MPTKAICLLLTISMLLTGCFTQTAMTRDEPPPDDSKVLFHLVDGSYIKSPPGNHHRQDEGYQVSGEIVKGGLILKKVERVVHDNEIDRITVERFHAVGTIALIGGGIIVVVIISQLPGMTSVAGL